MKKSKSPFVKVNFSSSFAVRTICKECGELPTEYYWVNHPTFWIDPRHSHAVFDWYKKYIKRATSSWYKKHQPRNFTSVKEFSLSWMEKSYKDNLHQHTGVDQRDTITEFVVCPCGKSAWAFNQKSAQTRMEIKHRKSRYTYPYKFHSF